MAFEGPANRGERPDVILVDTTWNNVDFLAYQLARRGLGVHAFTPRLRRPRYLRARLSVPVLRRAAAGEWELMIRSGRWSSGSTRRTLSRARRKRCTGCGISLATSSGGVSRMWRRPSGHCCWIVPCCWSRRPPGECRSRQQCHSAAAPTVTRLSPQACRSWSSRDSRWGAGA